MRRAILLVVAVAIGFTACKRDDAPEGKKEVTGITTLTASHDQPGTRISISVEHEGTAKDQTLWRAGDKLYIYELSYAPDEMGEEEGDIYMLHPEYFYGDKSPIVFDITSGEGSTSAKFKINDNETDGLDSEKKYVAIHTNGGVGGVDDIVRYVVGSLNMDEGSFLRLGGGASSASSGDGSELCEDNIVLYAPLVFEDGVLASLTFQPTAQSIMEFNLKLEDGNTDNVTLSYIKLTALDPETDAPVEVFAKSMDVYFNNNMGPILRHSDESVSDNHRFTSTGNLSLKSSESTRFRFPISWDRKYPDTFGNKEIKIEIGVKVGGVDMIHTETFTKPSAGEYFPAFLPGVTYSKPITVVPVAVPQPIDDIFPLITDAIFKAHCEQYDIDLDGKLSLAEAQAVTSINVNSKEIASLEGIQYFTKLTELSCYSNELTILDISKNTKLTSLDCGSNQLTTLDISKNTKLTIISYSFNYNMSSLDLSKHVELTSIDCRSCRITTLDLSKNTKLETFNCSMNQLDTLNLSKNIELTKLYCDGNELESLALRENTKLKTLACGVNKLTALDVSKNTNLEILRCESNQLTTLDISNNTKLYSLSCAGNPSLTRIFVWDTFNITTPASSIKSITKDDHSNFVKLSDDIFPLITDASFNTFCKVFDTDLDGKLTLAEAQAVTDMNVSFNTITSLNGIEFFTELTKLNCNNNNLQSLNLSKNTELSELQCVSNNLQSLDLSNNTKLTKLFCFGNQLPSLDLSKNTELAELVCYKNKLKDLDMRENTKLTSIECYDNQLTALDVSENTKLSSLNCKNNQLPSLDLSKSTELTVLYCNNNQLTGLDLSSNTKLSRLICANNIGIKKIFVWSDFNIATPSQSLTYFEKDAHSVFEHKQ